MKKIIRNTLTSIVIFSSVSVICITSVQAWHQPLDCAEMGVCH